MKLCREDFDKLCIWWNIAYEENDTEIFNKCNDTLDSLIKEHIEKYRYKKCGKWDNMKLNDLCYIPEHYMNEKGILQYYYTKDDVIRICSDNKVIGKHVYKYIKGERVENYVDMLKEEYFQWFTEEPTANLYKSPLSKSMFEIMSQEKKDVILTVLSKEHGCRY